MDGEPRVAVVGAGRMGAAMVGTLRRAGLEVLVHNRTRAKAEAVAGAAGATVAATAREAAAGAQVVLSSLADDAAVGAAYTGSDGIVAGLQPGTVICESSTIDPGTVHRLRPLVEDRGRSCSTPPSPAASRRSRRARSPSWPAATRPSWSGPGRCSTRWPSRSSTSASSARGR